MGTWRDIFFSFMISEAKEGICNLKLHFDDKEKRENMI